MRKMWEEEDELVDTVILVDDVAKRTQRLEAECLALRLSMLSLGVEQAFDPTGSRVHSDLL